jgi:transcriptional regulator with XRE-family HTH domain
MPQSTSTEAYEALVVTLLALRKEAGITQAELAARLGKTQVLVSNVEKGIRRLDVIEFYALTRALGWEPERVFAELCKRLPRHVTI